MNRLTVLVDISGRMTLDAERDPIVAAAAVAVLTNDLPDIRSELSALPKWAAASPDNIEHVADLLRSRALATVVVSLDRGSPAWAPFIAQADELQRAILRTSRSVAGWAKPANILRFLLLGSAVGATLGHAIYLSRGPAVLSASGLRAVDCSVVCDNEIQGRENIEVFRSFWEEQRIPRQKLARFNVEMLARDVTLTTEQLEPALLLPDYVAGAGLAFVTRGASIPDAPVNATTADSQVRMLRDSGKLLVHEERFYHSYDEIFGVVMEHAREINDA